MRLLPSRRQWAAWSLPSKLTALGAYVGVVGLVLAVVFFVASLRSGTDSVLLAELRLAAQRQAPVHRLIWRIYFDAVELDEVIRRDVPAIGSTIKLRAIFPRDRLYNEAGFGPGMGVDLTFQQPHGTPVATVTTETTIGQPFLPVSPDASICRWPSYGTFIACHWELEPGTQLKDLEELDFLATAYAPAERALNVKRIVVMADHAPTAIFDDLGSRSYERRMLDYSLLNRAVHPKTGDLLDVRQ